MSSTAAAVPNYPQVMGHPRPLWLLFMTEFWERFCYYGMRWALALYVVAAFYGGDNAKGEAPAQETYGAYTALVYATGLAGGFVADRILGYQRTVLLGGVFIAAGLFTIMVQEHTVFLIGLSLIIVGNGLFKPNISSMVGALYKQGDSGRDRGFTIFYMGINAGAFFAPLITGWLASSYFGGTEEHKNYSVVFACAGIGMLLGLVWFGIGRKQLLGVGAPPAGKEGAGPLGMITVGGLLCVPLIFGLMKIPEYLTWILAFGFVVCMVMLIQAGIQGGKEQLDKIWAMLILFLANVLFWMMFEQAGTSFTFLSEKVVDRHMFGGEFKTAWFQSVNPASIVVLAPIVTVVWLWTSRKGIEPSIPRKFGFGLIFNALGFGVLWWALSAMLTNEGSIPFWPLAMCYVLQTIGELCISPIGLSMVTKLAPPHMVGATMGAWFMSVSLGNKVAGSLAAGISGETGLTPQSAQAGFSFFFWLLLGFGAFLFLVSPIINKLMHGVK